MPNLIRDLFPEFIPTQEEGTNVYRYVRAHDEELEEFAERVDQTKHNRYVNQASGRDLDRIGAMFGTVGLRSGRTDQQYRQWLKSIVPVFSGRGEIVSVKRAISNSQGIPEDEVTIEENFETNSFTVELENWDDHTTATIDEIANTASPSGVEHTFVRYLLVEAEAESDDTVALEIGYTPEEKTASNDTYQDVVEIDIGRGVERGGSWDSDTWDSFDWGVPESGVNRVTATDTTIVSETLFRDATETTQSTDTITVTTTDTTIIQESTQSLDTVDVTTIESGWDSGSWDEMTWT